MVLALSSRSIGKTGGSVVQSIALSLYAYIYIYIYINNGTAFNSFQSLVACQTTCRAIIMTRNVRMTLRLYFRLRVRF